MMVKTAKLTVSARHLLESIWYSDGSGAQGPGVGINDLPSGWEIDEITFPDAAGDVTIHIRRKEEAP